MPMLPAEMMALSTRVLEVTDGKKPEEAAMALLISLGRLAGRYGVKTRSGAEFWGEHTGDMGKSLFMMGFEVERKNAPKVGSAAPASKGSLPKVPPLKGKR